MRALPLALALMLCACPQPEDAFVISGQLVTLEGEPRPDVEVTLRRSRFASETRCERFDELRKTTSDSQGFFSFQLLRQEALAGVNARRFFEVEAPGVFEGTITKRFWFPNADFDVGQMGLPVLTDAQVETRVDDHTAWRGARFQLDRPTRRREVRSRRDWVTPPIDSLGRFDVIPLETRVESPWIDEPGRTGFASSVIGAECPEIGIAPCPLTDGRFLPYEFPPDTRQLLFNFKQEVGLGAVFFHGLHLARPAVKVRQDFSFFVDFTELTPLPSFTLAPAQFERAQDSCDEPGAFVLLGSGGSFKPVVWRVRFEDAAGEVIPILSLQEVSIR